MDAVIAVLIIVKDLYTSMQQILKVLFVLKSQLVCQSIIFVYPYLEAREYLITHWSQFIFVQLHPFSYSLSEFLDWYLSFKLSFYHSWAF